MAYEPVLPVTGGPVVLQPGQPRWIITAHPSRLLLVVAWASPVVHVYLWPSQQVGVYGIGGVEGESCVRIHRAAYPGLCQGEWYAVADDACTLYLIDQAQEDLPR